MLSAGALLVASSIVGPPVLAAVDVSDSVTPQLVHDCAFGFYGGDNCPTGVQTTATVSVPNADAVPYKVTTTATYGNATDTVFMFSQTYCTYDGVLIGAISGGSLAAWRNLLVGQTATLTPSIVVFVPYAGGTLQCSLRTYGAKGDDPTHKWKTNSYNALSGLIRVTGPLLPGSDDLFEDAETTIGSGSAPETVLIQSHPVAATATSVQLYGEAYLTNTGSSGTSQVKVDVVFAQYPYDGTYCYGPLTASSGTVNISHTQHHLTVFQTKAVTLAASPCWKSMKAVLRVTWLSGPAVTVGVNGTTLAIAVN